ncbi:MAG TPA: hypothetical protein VE826_11870 [Dongiaceae bacterium]|nr:hypothetical protein [Dongiaceae bacterium]
MQSDSVFAAARAFETQVIASLEAAGLEIFPDMLVGGDRVDAVIFRTDVKERENTVAVEISYVRPGVAGARKPFILRAYRLAYLVNRGLVANGLIVTNHPIPARDVEFTRDLGIGVVVADTPDREDLRDRVIAALPQQQGEAEGPISTRATLEHSREAKKRIFVAIQFSPNNEDLFNYGISAVAERLGMEAFRSLEVEHNEIVIEMIQKLITESDYVIADLSDDNPNVYYEAGFAHALRKPTILCARKGVQLRFDVAPVNCIFYNNITELSSHLGRRLTAMFDADN